MKIEMNLLEMTFDQRRDAANFVLTYPPAVPPVDVQENDILKAPRTDEHITEEQRLDAEQKEDLSQAEVPGANLNAIFGTPVPTVSTDKEGLPWDHRIHASTKTFIADGTWKLKRGVDATEVTTVKEQLKALMCVPAFVPQPPKSHYLTDQQPTVAVTLTELIARMSAAIAAGKLTQAQVSEACVKHGVTEFALLSSRPDLLPLIDVDMKAIGV